MTAAQDLLIHLGEILGLPDLAFDGNGCARLVFDQTVAIDLEYEAASGNIHVYSVLGAMPADGTGEALYRHLLQANFAGRQTHGATLSVDEARREIVLFRSVPVDCTTAAVFAGIVDQVLAAIGVWQERLTRVEAEDDALA